MAKVQLLGDKADGYQLTVDGEPFFIKGAGLEFGHLKSLAEAGGNAFRTWRVANGERDAIDILDEADALGLKVCMGLDIARERHGFDYSDQDAVSAQNEEMMRDVVRLKDHPALLMWGLGNELNLRAKNDGVWDAIEDLALRIKEADPDHPLALHLYIHALEASSNAAKAELAADRPQVHRVLDDEFIARLVDRGEEGWRAPVLGDDVEQFRERGGHGSLRARLFDLCICAFLGRVATRVATVGVAVGDTSRLSPTASRACRQRRAHSRQHTAGIVARGRFFT